MFGVTLRTNFNDLRPSYTITPARNINRSRRMPFCSIRGGESVNAVEIQCRTCRSADPAKGDTLYVTGEQVKYRDPREGSSVLIGS